MNPRTFADLLFAPISNALISSLASRSHQWHSWEILQCFEADFQNSPQANLNILNRFVEIRISLDKNQNSNIHFKSSWTASPSMLLNDALERHNFIQPSSQNVILGNIQNTKLTLKLTPPIQIPLYSLDDPLPPESQLSAEDTALKSKSTDPNISHTFDIRYCNNYGNVTHTKLLKK